MLTEDKFSICEGKNSMLKMPSLQYFSCASHSKKCQIPYNIGYNVSVFRSEAAPKLNYIYSKFSHCRYSVVNLTVIRRVLLGTIKIGLLLGNANQVIGFEREEQFFTWLSQGQTKTFNIFPV